MRRTLGAVAMLVALAGLGCAQPPGGIEYASGQGAVTSDGLHRVEWEPFAVSYVKPGADLQRYSKVHVQEATVSVGDSDYELPDSALAAVKRFFHEAFVKALSESASFTVTTASGPDVLLVSGQIVDLTVSVPPQADQAPDEDVYTTSAGRMTLLLDARDSVSNAPLVRVAETRLVELASGSMYESDPVSNSAAVKQIFREWADAFRRELDQFHALPALPPAPAQP